MGNEYNEESLMPFGKYRLWPIKHVPVEYLIELHRCGNGRYMPTGLYDYLVKNLDLLKSRIGLPLEPLPPKPLVHFICTKETYPTEADARYRMKSIRSKIEGDKKPLRVYECPHCSGWHLTSKPDPRFKTNP